MPLWMSISLALFALVCVCWLLFSIIAWKKISRMDERKVRRLINRLFNAPLDDDNTVDIRKRFPSIKKFLLLYIAGSLALSILLTIYSLGRGSLFESSLGKVTTGEILLWSAALLCLSSIYLLGLFAIVSAMQSRCEGEYR